MENNKREDTISNEKNRIIKMMQNKKGRLLKEGSRRH